jgi:single stranded DNA-binding protein
MGYAGRDGEMRFTRAGVPLGTVNIATNRLSRRDGKYVEVADWHRIKGFGPVGEQLAAVRKGDRIFVEAELQYLRWADKEDVVHYRTDLIAKVVVNTREHEGAVPEYEQGDEESPAPEEP